MRRDLLCAAAAAFLLLSGHAHAFQNAQGQPTQNQAQQQQSAAPSTTPSAPPGSAQAPAAPAPGQSTVVSPPPQTTDPLVAAARKAREQKKDQAGAKPPRVFNNDNIPTQGGVSAVGQNPAGDNADGTDAAAANAGAPASGGASAANGEKAWRDRFAKLRKKLEQDQADLELMQRELGVLDVQYYNDPVKAMQQGYSRSDINEKTDKIEAKKKTIEADNQAIADAEDELQRAGGDPGWAR
ncbi:MAG: hypothetical protein ABSC10_05025 [Candidatus Acidiferrales bacterium]|jgi:hypothetical protein